MASLELSPLVVLKWPSGLQHQQDACKSLLRLGLVIIPLLLSSCGRTDPAPASQLTTVLADWRPIEGRLSGDFAYAEYQPDRNGDNRRTHLVAIARVAADLELKYGAAPDPETLGQLGQLALVRGLDQAAIATLKMAVMRAPESLTLKNDLAVAYLAAAETQPVHLLRALEVIDEVALRPDAGNEPLFNRALILQRLHLKQAALQAWHSFLDRADNAWNPEAHAYLQALERKPVSPPAFADQLAAAVAQNEEAVLRLIRDRPAAARTHAATRLLPEWAAAVRDHDPARARQAAHLMAVFATERADTYGDLLLADTLAAIEKAGFSNAWAEGFRYWSEGLAIYERQRYKEAQAPLERASQALAGNPFHFWSEYYLALTLYQDGQSARAGAILDRLIHPATDHNYKTWLCYALNLNSQYAGRADPLTGLKNGLASVALARALNEPDRLFAAQKNVPGFFKVLGDDQRSLEEYLLLLDTLNRPVPPTTGYLAYGALGLFLQEAGKPGQAAYFFDEMVAYAEAWSKRDSYLATALRSRGYNLYELGEIEKADADLERSELLAELAPSPATRTQHAAERNMIRGRLLLNSSAAAALPLLDQAYAVFEGDPARAPELLLLRARAKHALGDGPGAEADLQAGLDLLEDVRLKTPDDYRISFFDHALNLYDEMIRMLIQRRDSDGALAYAERARSRFLLDHLDKTPGGGLPARTDLDPIQALIPTDSAIIYFFLAERQLAVWTLTRTNRDFRLYDLDRDSLNRDLELLSAAWTSDQAETELPPVLRHLGSLLPAALWEGLSDKRTLILAPDKELWSVPFPALIRNGHYLVERHFLALIPSLAHYRYAMAAPTWNGPPRTLLALGNPRFDALRFKDFDDLPWAEREVAQLGGYPRKQVLQSRDASPSHFLELAPECDVIHVAAHAVIDSRHPLNAKLLLAANDREDGVLTAALLYRQRLERTRVVVLATCEAGRAGSSVSEGGGDLARPFLAAGAPSVIAALRPLDDAQNLDFAVILHQYLSAGRTPTDALAETQRTLIRQSKAKLTRHSVWAHYQVYGRP